MNLRDFRMGDFEAVYRLDQACFEPGIAYARSELRRFLSLSTAQTVVAEAAGLVGPTLDIRLGWTCHQIGKAIEAPTPPAVPAAPGIAIGDTPISSADSRALREALAVALESEVKAYDFFCEALKLPVAEPVRKLFEELKQEEVLHQELVNKQLAKVPPDPGVPPEDYADEPVAQ